MTQPSSHRVDEGGVIAPQRNGALWIVALLAGWIWTWIHLSNEWSTNEQYEFGFIVPLLTGYLAWERMMKLPAELSQPSSGSRKSAPGLVAMGAAFAGLFLGELLREQDPTWRLCGWLLAFSMTLLTMTGLWNWRGPGMVRWLAFPLAFHLLILPWPSLYELKLTVGLLGLVTSIVTDILNWTGIAAWQHGNLIQLSNGTIGVDIACSGVQSFQSSLMASLFLGEFFWLSRGRRAALLGAALVAAFIGNLIRTFVLSKVVASQGELSLSRYHDPVGYSVTFFTFGTIFLIAWLLTRKKGRTDEPAAAESKSGPMPSIAIPGNTGLAATIGMVLILPMATLWFLVTPGGKVAIQEKPYWKLDTVRTNSGWKVTEQPFTAVETNVLRFTSAESVSIRTSDGLEADINHIFWAPKASIPSVAFAHTPDICMPSGGWTRLQEPKVVSFSINGHPVTGTLHRYGFERREEGVLHIMWDESPVRQQPVTRRFSRLFLLWDGPRKRGHEMLLIFYKPTNGENLEPLKRILDTVLQPAPVSKP
ncbi:MAG TPA: exosortase/archaeosortase family protein [Roseimicrobium sp.]|nr:exosortase/archaeosortase family protein [Roseimicrobium sp.]